MSIDRYDPIRVLGEGSFGKVYLMRDKTKRNFVCVKIIKIKNIPKKEREATKLEVDLLKRLNHPNIVGYVDSFLSKNQESLCICMEYCDGGDLASQIKAAKRNLFSESKILHWFVQLALGLHYMHGNRILHRDLKTQNVFLLGNGRLVLGDLGISKVLDGTMDFAQTCIGTPYYMSPEIFKNKPYSYKSDVWALGCILYELTTLNHAFDANSLNGLATKIVKGKYPPISNKYSKHLRDLITQMLMLNPQQRPDVDQILRKPFIKKHIVNFFVDIYSRPSTSIGEGTMILKAAAGGAGSGGSIMNDHSMINFRHQLQQLDMMDMVQEALRPKEKPQDDQEAIRQAKEQASALKREQEHKKMVEAALEKLRQEREMRAHQRGVAPGAGPVGRPGLGGGGGGVPSANAPVNGPSNMARKVNPSPSHAAAAAAAPAPALNRNVDPYARRDAKETPSPANAPGGNNGNVRDRGFNWDQRPVRGGGVGGNNEHLPGARYDDASSNDRAPAGARRRSFEDAAQNKAVAPSAADREKDRVERDRRAAEERRRLIQEQEAAAAAAKARVEEHRRREEAKAAEVLARAKAEAEAERLRLEVAKDKAEQASRLRRDAQRERERERQRLEIEQLKKDKLELDRRTHEREKMREDRRVQEAARMDAVRREQMDVMQEKLDFMNDQIQKLDIPPRRPQPGGAAYVPSMAEEKSSSDLSARERAHFRRDTKAAAKDEYEEADGGYDAIGRRSRLAQQQQQQQMKESGSNVSMSSNSSSNSTANNNNNNSNNNNNNNNIYVGRNRGNFSSDPAPQALPGEFSPPPAQQQHHHHHRHGSIYEYDANAQRSSRRLRDGMEDAARYGGNGNGNGNQAHNKNGGGGHGSDSDDEDLFVAKDKVMATSNADEEEEDLVRREEELRAELNFATMRCEELKRTLQETKSFLGPRLPTRGKVGVSSAAGGPRPMAPPASAAALGMAANGGGGIAVVETDDEDDMDEDDFLTEDEDEEGLEEQAAAGRNNNSNNRGGGGGKSSFSIQTDFDDGDNSPPGNNLNNPDRTLPRLRPPVSAVPSSAYGALQDMPSPSGKLSDRIERLRQRCKEALGERVFWEAYNFLKQHEMESQGYDNGRDLNDDDYEARKLARVRAILGERKEHYVSLIDQLIFMEDAEHD